MMQGDAYGQPVMLKRRTGEIITPDDVLEIEICIDDVRKTYADGGVIWNAEIERWVVPLTQEETFSFPASRVSAQARVMLTSGYVEGIDLGMVVVRESRSKVVLRRSKVVLR